MTQSLRAHIVFTEAPVWFLSPKSGSSQTAVTPVAGKSVASGPLRVHPPTDTVKHRESEGQKEREREF